MSAAIRLPDTLTTARLLLRGPRLSDAPAIFAGYAQEARVTRFLVWTPHRDESDTRAFLTLAEGLWRDGVRMPYVLTERGRDEAIGMLEARVAGSMVDVGYVLGPAHWGKGYMPEAVRAVAEAALAHPALFRVQATCDVENVPSQRTLEKAGFAREGRLERYTVHPNVSPEPRPCYMYAVAR